MSEELLELAERCEAATGPDRALDAAIGAIPVAEFLRSTISNVGPQPGCAAYTASLDAAMTLLGPLEDPFVVTIMTDYGGLRRVRVWGDGNGVESKFTKIYVDGHTLPLALCAAALRARAANTPPQAQAPNTIL